MFARFRPAQLAPGVPLIELDELWARGIRGIVLDVDNTLCAWQWGRAEVPGPVAAWVAQARERGFRLCIISNGRPGRVAGVAEVLGLPFIARARKPFRGGFRRALELLGTEPRATAAVGDQLLTDVWGANRMGLYSILVSAISPREFAGTKISRLIESVIRHRLGLPGVYST
ncbi:MAG: YqeG family HAD IIIA-type phosphatase [Bacillota bacterium]|nr:YqeG family HAD IIIA-type phosphatase [Bacillota bacterium]